MRFSAPRSVSPSPVRRKPRNASTFGLQDDSDSEDYYSELESSFNSDSEDDVSIASSSSSNGSTFDLISDINKLSLRPRHITRTPLEERQIEETVAAIRLRARHHDPYEEWEQQTRKDSFKIARKEFSTLQSHLYDEQAQTHAEEEKRRAAQHSRHANEVQNQLEAYRRSLQKAENELKETWRSRERELWRRIDGVIKLEEDKLAKKLEEERRVREEEERKRKEAELKKRLADEKRKQEEIEKKQAEEEKKKAEEEKLRQEKEEEEKRRKVEEERNRKLEEEAELRRMLPFTSMEDDWRVARTDLHNLKTGPVRHVKSQKELKAEWSRLRRQIVPKIGQLTNDANEISRITQQLIEILKPSNAPPHNPVIYITLCYSLAKAILLQAETEVTAEKRSAGPLAQVTFTLIETLDNFPSIFFAKLVQRCGGWAIPLPVPNVDVDETPWPSREDYIKASGWRKSTSGDGLETTEAHSNRISAIMRVYFNILKIRPQKKPLEPVFQLPKYWTWFARMTGDTRLLRDPVAPQLIYTGLDVLGLDAKYVWGQQWIKTLALIHEGITTGYEDGKLIGGVAPEGAAARIRVMVALENIVNGVQS
ncbi:hypothetical protein GALMADRAFT_243109 [Galerina marginata CBS 339.88]|uniref:mRNA export factor GLE1 n=1 Tax=Galerina marginata (strain CBS 339.88) TaxID=685588 RepID=A0A067TJQ1_GALM3|nr:hypothetical protein GALMADRAFT_243109 [Galerina marginata CBS 339.88]